MSFLQKLSNIPREIILALILLAMIIPTLYPLGLPLMVSDMSRDWYNTVDELPEGLVVSIPRTYNWFTSNVSGDALKATISV